MSKKILITTVTLGLGVSSALANPGPTLPMPMAGSDTLREVTLDVVTACGLNTSVQYTGGGSGLGGTRMNPLAAAGFNPNGQQQIAPQSRFLNAAECNFFNTVVPYPGEAALPANPGQGVLLGLDGLAVFHDNTENSACKVVRYAGCMDVLDMNDAALIGYGLGATGVDDGVAALSDTNLIVPTSVNAVTGNRQYCFTHWADALRIIYMGQHQHVDDSSNAATAACRGGNPPASPLASRRCNSDVRWTLVSNWSNIFDSQGDDGAAGCADGNCTQGLKHAFRRDDFSGTTDIFLTLLGVTNAGASFNTRTFCNGLENEDLDPIRRRCEPDATSSNNDRETVCGATPFAFRKQPFDATTGNPTGATTSTAAVASAEPTATAAGDLGLVLPISLPKATVTDPNNPGHDLIDPVSGLPYNPQYDDNVFCSTSAINTPVKLAPMQSSLNTNMQRCPNGNSRVGNRCYWPVRQNNAAAPQKNGWFNCKARRNNRPNGSAWANFDARAYNRVPRHPVTGDILQPAYIPPGTTTPVVADPRFAGGGDGRIYMTFPKTTLANHPSCRSTDATLQIGCLVQADPCSIGYAGLGGTDNDGSPAQVAQLGTNLPYLLRANYDPNTSETLAAGDVSAPDSEIAPDPTTIRRLLGQTGAACNGVDNGFGDYSIRYPISRKLWINASKGFGETAFPFTAGAPRIHDLVDSDPDFTQVDPTTVNGPLTPDNVPDLATNENKLLQCFVSRGISGAYPGTDSFISKWDFITLPLTYPEASRLQGCPPPP